MEKRNGYYMQVRISYWAGETKLKAENIGKDVSELPEDIKLGVRRMYPDNYRKEFLNYTNGVRIWFNWNTLPTPLENVRFVPKDRLEAVVEGLRERRAIFGQILWEFIEQYETIKNECLNKHPDWADDFNKLYPDEDEMITKFGIKWYIMEIKPAEDPENEILVEAREELREQYRKTSEETIIFLRKNVISVMEELEERINKDEVIRNDSLDKYRRVLGWFSNLNVFGDTEFARKVDEMSKTLDGQDRESLRDNTEMLAKISGVAKQITNYTANIAEGVDSVLEDYCRVLE